MEDHEVPYHRMVLKDQTICFTRVGAAAKCLVLLHRVEVWNPRAGRGSPVTTQINQSNQLVLTIHSSQGSRTPLAHFFRILLRSDNAL